MGIVGHCNDINRSLPKNQKQADGYQDDAIPFENLSLMEQLNVVADRDAKEVLIETVECQRFITPDWPYKGIRIYVGGEKVTSSIKTTLYSSWGKKIAKEVMVGRGMVAETDFELIAFAIMREVMLAFPQMFRLWVCKMVSDFAGTNRMIWWMRPTFVHAAGRETKTCTMSQLVRTLAEWRCSMNRGFHWWSDSLRRIWKMSWLWRFLTTCWRKARSH
jgi:hypothetical protein